ncbi:hypothetical protein BD779DRAFT_1470784 [Infundibulicybe gibba]|nr:hypothetical protein BD779DRAFT_1470784 [Infundibulicybe gibba]
MPTVTSPTTTSAMTTSSSKSHVGLDYINRFPVEILAEIFSHTLPPRGGSRSVKSSLVLIHVCKRWRGVAFGCQRLWRHLTISLPTTSLAPADQTNVFYLIYLWCAALRSPTLAIHFQLPMYASRQSGRILLGIALRFSKCIRELDFPQHYLDFVQIAQYLPPTVDTLTLVSETDPQQRGKLVDYRALFESCRSLRKLNIWLEPGSFNGPAPFRFPWGQLTHIIIASSITATVWRQMLSVCKYAQLCSFKVEEITQSYERERYILEVESNPPITLPNLHTFAVYIVRLVVYPSIDWFPKLELPALTKFAFHQGTDHDPCFAELSAECLSSLKRIVGIKSLRVLSLAYVHMYIEHFIEILNKTPHLRELNLDCNLADYDPLSLSMTVPRQISDPSAPPILIPELETLLICCCLSTTEWPAGNFSLTELIEMVRSRMRNRSSYPLYDVVLKFENTNPALSEWVEDALEFYSEDVRRTIRIQLDPLHTFVPRVEAFRDED